MIVVVFNVAHLGLKHSSPIDCRNLEGAVFHNPWSSFAMSLQLCKSIAIHKVQGITVGEDQQFSACLAYLPTGRNRNTPGPELVTCSMAREAENLLLVMS